MEHLIKNSPLRLTLFTGSSKVAEHLAKLTHGIIKIRDAGLDWKILGPDLPENVSGPDNDLDYLAYVCESATKTRML